MKLAFVPRGNDEADENGTALAILYESDGPLPASRLRSGWGGARNSASRLSEHIRLDMASALVEAVQQASEAGLPLNRHLTVHWRMGGIPDSRAARATGKLTKLIADWLKRRGGRLAYAWIRENGDLKGSHAHLLFHLPEGVQLGHMTRRWAKLLFGRAVPKAIKTEVIGGYTRASFSGSNWYQDNLAYVLAYLLKGVDARSGTLLDLDRSGEGGWIVGKRVGISQNIQRGGGGR